MTTLTHLAGVEAVSGRRLTGAVASKSVTEAPKVPSEMVGNHS